MGGNVEISTDKSEEVKEKEELINFYEKRIRNMVIVFIALISFVSFLSIYVYIVVMEGKKLTSLRYLELVIPALLTAVSGICIFLGYSKLIHIDETWIKFEKSLEEKLENKIKTEKDIQKEKALRIYRGFYEKQERKEANKKDEDNG